MSSQDGAHPRVSLAAGALRVVFVALSPIVLYVAVTRLPLARGALLVVGWIALRTLPLLVTTAREHLLEVLKLPAIAVAFALVGAATRRHELLLLLPSATQLGFAWTFGASLRSGRTPLVERFARMQIAAPTPDEVAYCRRVTQVWAVFLAFSAAAGLALACWASPEVWTLFTGVVTYVLVAALFAGEYAVRSIRFRARRITTLQRLLCRLLPPSVPRAG
jgi:uncharacterized membrane protein